MHSSENNGHLRRALAISLAAHALLLWPGAVQRLPERAAGGIQATLRPVEAAAPPGGIASARPVPAKPLAMPARPQTAPATMPAAVPPSPTFAAPAAPADASSTAGGGERSTTPASLPPPAIAAAAGGGEGGGADADGRRQYRLALAREARRYKLYPQRALLAGIGGTVEVSVEHAAGALPVARLLRSSGHDSLDAAALEMMRQAAPRTAVPEPLRGRVFAVSLPVVFDVEEN